jgi:LuxR family transcriptional regulator, maltose regulon positive regulatory protein
MTSTMSEPTTRHARRGGQRAQLATKPIAASVASDKLRIPRPSVPLLHRPRVTDLIQRAAAHRVTLIYGPTGSGKTVACAMWAARAPGPGHVAWLSLDPGDRRPGRLWGDVKAALSRLPAMPTGLVAGLPAADSDSFPLQLAEAAERLTIPVTLIIDDLQEIAGSEVLPGIDLLVRHGPPALRLLLAGRHSAGIAVARLRVSGQLAEIGPADLACTSQEVAGYFAMLGVNLPDAQRDELLKRTQGWMTGLRLAALRATPGEPFAFWRIRGDEPVVADYLIDEVLATQPADRQQFLLRTSVTDRICGSLADAMTSASGSGDVLDQLWRENVMVHPVHSRSDGMSQPRPDDVEYRYHPLLLDLLRAELRRARPGEVPVLARRAAQWQASHGRPTDAIRSAAQAGDWELVSRVLAAAGTSMLLPGPAAELGPVLAACPQDRRVGDAAVACTLASASLRAGDRQAAAAHLANARRTITSAAAAERRTIDAWMQVLTLMVADGHATADAELIESSAAIAGGCEPASSPAEHQALGLLWCAIGVARLSGTDVPAARLAFSLARRHADDGINREFKERARGWQALAEALHGDLCASDKLIALVRSGDNRRTDRLALLLADLAATFSSLAKDEAGAARRLLEGQVEVQTEMAAGAAEIGGTAGASGTTGTISVDWPIVLAGVAAAAGIGLEATLITALATLALARLALCDADTALARNLATRLQQHAGASPSPDASPSADASVGAGTSLGSDADPTGGAGSGGVTDGSAANPIAPALALLDADLALRAGDPSRARLTLIRARERLDASREAGIATLLIAAARTQLAAGKCQDALDMIDGCLSGMSDHVTLHDHVTALVTAAVAHRKLGQAERATDRLTYALALAEPHGLRRPFLDGGAAARSALTALIRPLSPSAAFAGRILQRYDSCAGRPAEQQCPGPVALTSSELAVLRFLPSHMTNQEIAEALFLSINTVKTHLRSVYRKLGVTTRRQAISRSGRLGLL